MYYVGSKEERARRFASEVASVQFNVLVTTYEYIMRDRSKLSKVLVLVCLSTRCFGLGAASHVKCSGSVSTSWLLSMSTSCATAPSCPRCCTLGQLM